MKLTLHKKTCWNFFLSFFANIQTWAYELFSLSSLYHSSVKEVISLNDPQSQLLREPAWVVPQYLYGTWIGLDFSTHKFFAATTDRLRSVIV